MEDNRKIEDDLVHLARLALSGKEKDIQIHIRRVARRFRAINPEFSQELNALLRQLPSRSSPLRKDGKNLAIPVDLDSRFQLVRTEFVEELDVEPVFCERTSATLRQLINERLKRKDLEEVGLDASSSALFTGPPGVGKTLAAHWLAMQLRLPLLTLDLAAVMSSFLGRTGNNVRYVLEYAKSSDCILLLDELDAIAKRRDDSTEIGELKRLVTVLLQEIDNWPSSGLLIAATNHPDLLDPAIWRRFDVKIDFPLPDESMISSALERFLGADHASVSDWCNILPAILVGSSFSEIGKLVLNARRKSVIDNMSIRDELERVACERLMSLPAGQRRSIAVSMVSSGVVSQRRAHEITGVSRDTIRKSLKMLEDIGSN